jgi:hypothetical protein
LIEKLEPVLGIVEIPLGSIEVDPENWTGGLVG